MEWKTFGHDAVKKVLERQLTASKFPHAYVLTGPDGIGKKHLALEFSKHILKTDRLENHPDFQILENEGDVSIEQVREFLSTVRFKPFMGKYKVAIIDNAHNLNTQSCNAILKTLEEPSPSSIIILISSHAKLLPTIMSRCQALSLNAFTNHQLLEYASREGLVANQDTAALSMGSVGAFRALSAASEAQSSAAKELRELSLLPTVPHHERLLSIPRLAELETGELELLLRRWLYFEKVKLAFDVARVKVVNALFCALQDLRTNKNKKLILQGLMMRM